MCRLFINSISMKFIIDNSSKKKHYVEKDNFYIAENEKVLTIKTSLKGDGDRAKDIFDLFSYFLDLTPADKRAYYVLLNNNGIYLKREDLCLKTISIYGGNARAYYSNFKKLENLGIMEKNTNGLLAVSNKFNINNYKDVEILAFKI